MRKEKWVPAPFVAERTEGVITIGNMGLPASVDTEQIEFNVGALHRTVIGFGGYRELVLSGYRGERDQIGYSLSSGSNGVGHATGVTSVTRAKNAKSDSESDSYLNAANIRNGTLEIQWNLNAQEGRIESHEQYDSKVRARQIDRAIRRPAIGAVLSHNITEPFKQRNKFIQSLNIGIDSHLIGSLLISSLLENYDEAAKIVMLRSAILLGFRAVGASLNPVGAKFTDFISDPLFFSARPIRAVAAAGMLSTNKLVRANTGNSAK